MTGTCYGPAVTLPQDKIFFSPTYIGVSTLQKFGVKNDSRIPIEYEWRVPEKYKSEIIFTPNRSMLLPNEEAKVVATFTPLKKKEYSVTVPLFARNQFDNVKNFVGFYNPGSGLSLQGGASAPGSMGGVHTIRKELSICGAGSDGLIGISP